MRRTFWIVLFIIFFLALGIRTYKLETVPYGFHFDEAKAGWNAYSLLKTGRDDKGNLLPVYYDSFGDYRPMGIFYSIVPSLAWWGKNVFAVRFPAAFIGALTVFPIALLIKRFRKDKGSVAAWGGAILLALNPWHVIISRATSEAVISLFLFLWGLNFLLKVVEEKKWVWMVLTLAAIISSFFFYHSVRVLAPVFVVVTVGYFFSELVKTKNILRPVIVLIAVSVLSIFVMGSKESRARLGQVSILSDFDALYETQKRPNEEGPDNVLVARIFHNKICAYGRRMVEEYKNYFSTNFLAGTMAKPIRYTVPYVGLITYVELVLLVTGLIFLRKYKEGGLWGVMLLVAPLPAFVTIEDTPNMHRAVFMLPFIIMIEALGFYSIFRHKKWGVTIATAGVAMLVLNFVYFYHMYLSHQKFSLASYFRDGGTMELAIEINKIRDNYDKVILSNFPSEPSAWLGFFSNEKPEEFNLKVTRLDNGVIVIGNLILSNQRCPSNFIGEEENSTKLLVVDAEGCEVNKKWIKEGSAKLVGVIKRPDDSNPYYLWERNKLDQAVN